MPDFTLLDVSVHQFRDNMIVSALSAASAHPVGTDWRLEDVKVSRFSSMKTDHEQIETVLWSEFLRRNTVTDVSHRVNETSRELVSSDVLKSISISPESLSAIDLREQIRYLKDNQLDSRRIELAFWVKIASPLSTLVMLMLSLPFVFASQRSGGAGQKIFIGIILGILYVAAQPTRKRCIVCLKVSISSFWLSIRILQARIPKVCPPCLQNQSKNTNAINKRTIL